MEQFFAAARVATSPPMAASHPPAQPQPLSADALGLLSKLQSGSSQQQPPVAASVVSQPAPHAPQVPAQTSTRATVLDPALRTAIRQALARVVQEERFMQILEEEYVRAVPSMVAASARGPAARPQQAAARAAEPLDPKDGNALLKNLLSGLK